jgi:tetratricopeptide (TPR) repeat protein
MKGQILLLIILLVGLDKSLAQNCSQKLEDAKRAYFNGNLREVKPSLTDCLDNGLENEELIEGLKLMVNTHLLLNDNEQADLFLSRLLKVDPAHSLRESDLIEFENLFNTYEIMPRFAVGFAAGYLRPDYRIIKHQSYGGRTEELSDYTEAPGYFIGVTGDIPLVRDVFFNTGILFDYRGFEQNEIILDIQSVKTDEIEYRLNLPLQIRYVLPFQKFKPFIGGGFSYQYIIRAEADIERFALDPNTFPQILGVPNSVEDYDLTNTRRRSNINWLGSVGVQVTFEDILVEGFLSFEEGMNNVISDKNRYDDFRLREDFAYVPDDFKVSSWMFGVSVKKNFTKPKKK